MYFCDVPKKKSTILRTTGLSESQLDNRHFVTALSVLGETNKLKVQQNYFETTVHEQDSSTADFTGTHCEIHEETWKGELSRRDCRYCH